MTQEEFETIAKTKSELESFLEFTQDKEFTGIAAHSFMLAYNIYREITNKDIVNKIVELVQNELDNINKKIDEL